MASPVEDTKTAVTASGPPGAHDWIERVLFSEEEIQARVRTLAARINTDLAGKKVVVVGVLKGAFMFMSDLVRHLTMDHRVEFMAVSSYGDSTHSDSVRIIMDLRKDIAEEHVLIVEDIIDSGRTLHFLQNLLKARNPASVSTCVFLSKSDNRNWQAAVEYLGFEAPNHWVVGYGLDYAERLRTLPYVGVLKEEVYSTSK